jgi:hypothetical protein
MARRTQQKVSHRVIFSILPLFFPLLVPTLLRSALFSNTFSLVVSLTWQIKFHTCIKQHNTANLCILISFPPTITLSRSPHSFYIVCRFCNAYEVSDCKHVPLSTLTYTNCSTSFRKSGLSRQVDGIHFPLRALILLFSTAFRPALVSIQFAIQ